MSRCAARAEPRTLHETQFRETFLIPSLTRSCLISQNTPMRSSLIKVYERSQSLVIFQNELLLLTRLAAPSECNSLCAERASKYEANEILNTKCY